MAKYILKKTVRPKKWDHMSKYIKNHKADNDNEAKWRIVKMTESDL